MCGRDGCVVWAAWSDGKAGRPLVGAWVGERAGRLREDVVGWAGELVVCRVAVRYEGCGWVEAARR